MQNLHPPPSSANVTAVPITSDNVADYIYKIYKADVKAIQNLADIAMKLQTGGVTVPGNMTIQNTLTVNNATTLKGGCNFYGRDSDTDSTGIAFFNTVSMKRKDGRWTHFDWSNNNNYIRGDTIVDGILTVNNNLKVPNSIYADRLYINTDKAKIEDNGTALFNATTLYGNLSFTQKDPYISLIADGTLMIIHPGWNTYQFGRSLFAIYTNTKINGSLTVSTKIFANNFYITDNFSFTVKYQNKSYYSDRTWTETIDSSITSVFSTIETILNLYGQEIAKTALIASAAGATASQVSNAFYSCDRRIKNNIVKANSNEILNKINKLPMQNYNFIDKNFYNGDKVYGLIAQDVKEIIPEAVTISKQYIPNINKIINNIKLNDNNLEIMIDNKLKIDDNVKLQVNDKEVIVKVIDCNNNKIIIEKYNEYKDDDQVLVYGTMIDDFHALNQQYLGVLALGGIQELTKMVNSSNDKINKLENENSELKERLDKLEKIIKLIKTV